MIALFIAMVVASPEPLLPVPWESQPGRVAGQYARYVRHEADGSDSVLSAMSQACNTCNAGVFAQMLKNGAEGRYPTATVVHNALSMCGRSADRVVALGIAAADPRQDNFEMFFFRNGATMYTLAYTFRTAAPMPDAESALTALCPAGP
jgi:hypothetical protein